MEPDITYFMSQCSKLREDKTCKWKDESERILCTTNPKKCCSFCEDNETNCDSIKGICTYLF